MKNKEKHSSKGGNASHSGGVEILLKSKETKKIYYRHSGYPGGIKSTTIKNMREAKPEEILERAVKGMLPRNPLGRAVFRKLKVYAGDTHPHDAQQPKTTVLF